MEVSTDKVQPVYKATLSTGKEIILKEMTIKAQNLAVKSIGNKADENKILAGSLIQQELLKILLVSINGKKPDPKELEKLDQLFTYREYIQVMKVIDKIAGGDDLGEYQMETVITGAV